MITPRNQPVTFFAFFTAAKVGKTALTVTVNVRKNGTLIVTGAAATEEGNGLYRYTLVGASNDTDGNYSAVFITSDSTVDYQNVPALWVSGQGLAAGLTGAANTNGGLPVNDVNLRVAAKVPGAGDFFQTFPPGFATTAAQTGDSFARLGVPTNASIAADIATRASPGAAMTLTAGERIEVANEVERQIIDETDTEKVLTAITDKIAAANPSLAGLTIAAIASAVRSEMDANSTKLDVTIGSRMPANTAVALVQAAIDAIAAALQTAHGAGSWRAADVSAAPTVAAIDLQLTGSHGAGSWQTGGGGGGGSFVGAETVTLEFVDAIGNPVPFVSFTIVGIGSDQADAQGSATINLSAGNYTVRTAPAFGTLFNDQDIVVTVGGNTLTITGESLILSPSPTPGLTRCYTTMRDSTGAVVIAQLEFRIVDPGPEDSSWAMNTFMATSDSSGLLTADLVENSYYEVRRGSGPWQKFFVRAGATQRLPEVNQYA